MSGQTGFIIRTLCLGLAFLLTSCRQPSAMSGPVRSALQSVAGIDLQPDHYPSYDDYHGQVYRKLETIVQPISSAAELKLLFQECHKQREAAPEVPQERLQWINPLYEIQNAILFRLAEISSDEAAKVLVELFADDSYGWDGEFSLNVGNAITRCGKQALPHLAKLNSGEREWKVQQLISCIQKGPLYGP